jgi:hypothetical protein
MPLEGLSKHPIRLYNISFLAGFKGNKSEERYQRRNRCP